MFKNRRILVIDDDPGVRDAYKGILAETDTTGIVEQGAMLFGEAQDSKTSCTPRVYDLTLSDSAKSSIAAVEQSVKIGLPFAVAFVDMNMPKVNGAEATRRIWAIDPDIKVVIVTAFSEYQPCDIIRILGREDVFYLRKPFHSEEIRQFAGALTSFWNVERENRILLAELRSQAASMGAPTADDADGLTDAVQRLCDNLLALKTWANTIAGPIRKLGLQEASSDAGPISDRTEWLPEKGFAADEFVNLVGQTLRDARKIMQTLRKPGARSQIQDPSSRPADFGRESH